MNSIFTASQKVFLIDTLINLIAEPDSANVYLGVGRVADWSANDSLITDPDQSTDSLNTVHRNLVALKKITAGNMSVVIRRRDWANGTVYDAYSNSADMFATSEITTANGSINVSSRTITGTNTTLNLDFLAGEVIRLSSNGNSDLVEDKEIVEVVNATFAYVNTAFNQTYTNNAVYKIVDTYPEPVKNFYVRNSKDQVFKCLFNNHGAQSTIEPEITIGGQLPESTYIQMGDGYKWKYMCSIDSTAKRKFFTSEWMPVKRNLSVSGYAVDGSIDIVDIINPGIGYNANLASANALILSITGDGTGANLSAKVNSQGSIYDVNILDGGSGYTTASITVSTAQGGSNANLVPVIGPKYGHGYDPVSELGGGNMIISVELQEDENGTIPTDTTTGNFDYHQIVLIKDPVLTSGEYASATNYDMTTQILTQGTGTSFQIDEVVYQGLSLGTASWRAEVVRWDPSTNILYVNNQQGAFSVLTLVRGETSGASSVATEKIDSDVAKFTGKILYINNTTGIVRASGQTEQLKIALSFK